MDYIPQACSRSSTGHPMPKYRHRLEHQPTEVFPVFGIETYEIYADVGIQLLVSLQLAGYLQHDGYSAGSIVGCHYRLAPVGAVGVVVGKDGCPNGHRARCGFQPSGCNGR